MKTSMNKANDLYCAKVIKFCVDEYGTISVIDFPEKQTRAEFYDDLVESCTRSPVALLAVIEECEPLAWAVKAIYSDVREALVQERESIADCSEFSVWRATMLEHRLHQMPVDPEEDWGGWEAGDTYSQWLLGLSPQEFDRHVVTALDDWLNDSPDFLTEAAYLPLGATAQGAAFQFFSEMSPLILKSLGVVIVEGDHPGSTYFAAELVVSTRKANAAARAAAIPVRFKETRLA